MPEHIQGFDAESELHRTAANSYNTYAYEYDGDNSYEQIKGWYVFFFR